MLKLLKLRYNKISQSVMTYTDLGLRAKANRINGQALRMQSFKVTRTTRTLRGKPIYGSRSRAMPRQVREPGATCRGSFQFLLCWSFNSASNFQLPQTGESAKRESCFKERDNSVKGRDNEGLCGCMSELSLCNLLGRRPSDYYSDASVASKFLSTGVEVGYTSLSLK